MREVIGFESNLAKNSKTRVTRRAPTKVAKERIEPMTATREKLSNKTIARFRPTRQMLEQSLLTHAYHQD